MCESTCTFNVVTSFRPKDTNLHCLHYQAATNLGLIQSNMTYLYSRCESDYHWVLDLYTRMGLPELDGMKEFSVTDDIFVLSVVRTEGSFFSTVYSARKTMKIE